MKSLTGKGWLGEARPFLAFFAAAAMILSAVSPMFGMLAANAAEDVELFSDDFESSPPFSEWAVSDSKWSVVDSFGEKKASVKGNTQGVSILSKAVSTEGFDNIVLSYKYTVFGSLEGGDEDHVLVEWSADGSTWNTVADYTGIPDMEDWVSVSHILSGAENSADFQMRFSANLSSGADDFRVDDVLLTGDSTEDSEAAGSIRVVKFHDEDGNGVWDDGEPALEGWEICLWNSDEVEITCEETDENGEVVWQASDLELGIGTYIILEEEQEDWFPTTQEGLSVLLELGSGEAYYKFGNNINAVKEWGYKFHDFDFNGEWDGDEPGLGGWTIKATPIDGEDGNPVVDDGRVEKTITTVAAEDDSPGENDILGYYEFNFLPEEL